MTTLSVPTWANTKHQTSSEARDDNSFCSHLGKHQTSNIKHQTSNIKHQTSNIKHQTSNIKHQTSSEDTEVGAADDS
jgi:hypothetical protein